MSSKKDIAGKAKKKIADLFEVASGSTPSTSVESYWSSNGNGIKWITPKDLSGLESSNIFTTERKITLEGLNSCSARLIPKESIILSSRAPIGYVAVMKDEMSCNQGCKALIPKKPKEVDSLYFYYLFLTKEKELNNLGSGSTFKELSKTKLEEFSIEVHDINEQKKIAHVLEQADKARQQRKAANALTDQFLQSSFLSLFGDPVKNEKGFKICKLETLYSNEKDGTKCGPFGSALKKGEYVESGIPVWVMDNIVDGRFVEEGCLCITNEKYEELKSYSVENGDIIISRAGTVGKMCVLNSNHPKSIISTNLIKLSLNPEKLVPMVFVSLMTYFGTRVGKLRTGTDGAFSHMNTGVLNNLEFPLPPLSLQKQFAGIVAQAEQLQQKQKESERELENLFQGLLQRYFG